MKSFRQAIFERKINIYCIAFAICVYIINKTILIPNTLGKIGLFCKCYLNDLVCPLFFLGYCQILLIWVNFEMKSYKAIIILGIVAGVIWEFFAPMINHKSVTDYFDLLCYFVGSLLFAILYCKKGKRNQINED